MLKIYSVTRYFGNNIDRKIFEVFLTIYKKKALYGSNACPFRLCVPSPTLHDIFIFWGKINV
jgi:hypothetical protein